MTSEGNQGPSRERGERERLEEFVTWWESEHGEVTEAELTEGAAERQEIQRLHEVRKASSAHR